jgi:hypothetical protein
MEMRGRSSWLADNMKLYTRFFLILAKWVILKFAYAGDANIVYLIKSGKDEWNIGLQAVLCAENSLDAFTEPGYPYFFLN